ncbi:MAG: ice-binding family protein [Candidatus Aenigmatarchaeota archaeon]
MAYFFKVYGELKMFNKILSVTILVLFVFAANVAFAATSPSLGAAGSYSVLAGSIVTNTGPTTVNGDLGVSPSIGVPPHVTGFPPGVVGPPGTIHDADAHAGLAQAANTAAFGALDQPCTTTYAGTKDLVGSNLVPGVYCADAFTLTGTLTLTGSGVWIFKSSSTLITSGTANVVGGDQCDVWWRVVSSATLGTNTQLTGNVLALTSISLQTGATLNGRALAQTGQVSLDDNTVTTSSCTSNGGGTGPPVSVPTMAPIVMILLIGTMAIVGARKLEV